MLAAKQEKEKKLQDRNMCADCLADDARRHPSMLVQVMNALLEKLWDECWEQSK